MYAKFVGMLIAGFNVYIFSLSNIHFMEVIAFLRDLQYTRACNNFYT
jgi:hypothetical protein